jgi:hypothetical protein
MRYLGQRGRVHALLVDERARSRDQPLALSAALN